MFLTGSGADLKGRRCYFLKNVANEIEMLIHVSLLVKCDCLRSARLHCTDNDVGGALFDYP